MPHAISDEALETIFRDAHTQNKMVGLIKTSNAMLMAVWDFDALGAHRGQLQPGSYRLHHQRRSQGARLKPLLTRRQSRKDHDRACHRHHRL